MNRARVASCASARLAVAVVIMASAIAGASSTMTSAEPSHLVPTRMAISSFAISAVPMPIGKATPRIVACALRKARLSRS